MAISRVIEVSFRGSSVALVRIDTAYFYNNGILFKPTDIDLPASYQAHWADSPQAATTIETIGTAEGAPIPDDLWNRSRVIYGWIYLHPTEDSSVTGYEVRIYKNVRAGLPDGTEPTPEEQSVIDQAISALNTAVAKTAQDVISADQSARSASGDADRAERARTGAETAQGKAEEAQESAERAKDDAETSERNASESERNAKGYAETASEKADSIHSMTASAQTLPAGSSASASYNAETGVMSFGIPKGKDGTDGEDGEDGTDGIDGISPSVSVTDITGGHRVVITDKDGAKSFDVEDGATGATPNLTIGTVETLDPTDDATATITGTPENPVLNLGIPQGDTGEVTTEEFLKAFVTDTASGAIASFSDGADDLPLKSLIVDINPVQDLHGQDAPYPAGGGKNLYDPVKYRAYGLSNTVSLDGDTYTITWINGAIIFDTKNVQMYDAGEYTISAVGTNLTNVNYYAYSSTDATLRSGSLSASRTFTASEPFYLGFNGNYTNPGTASFKIQLEKGSTATAYSPYENLCPISGWTEVNVNHSDADTSNPTTITIQFGQTVYGGKLDVLSGVLTVDRAMVDLGTLNYMEYVSYPGLFFINNFSGGTAVIPANNNTLPSAICSLYKPAISRTIGASGHTIGEFAIAVQDRLYVADDRYIGDAAAFKAAMSGVQLVYELATPIEIQLSANQINSLLGINNIWADSGDCTAEYRADTKLFIERLTAPDSADMVADANITSGQYFMVGNSLYKATANIANGSAIVVGTNCIRKSLSEALNEINA